jgi:plasmid stability protein
MSDSSNPSSDACDLELPSLSAGTHEVLSASARRHGHTVHEEAEHIIKSHLASDEDED